MKQRLLVCLLVLFSSALFSQVITPFSIRYQTTQKGGIRYISNTAVSCSGVGCGAGRAEVPPAGTSTDNGFTAGYVDIDADGTTFQSSSDSLALPTCSEISWAGLYWGGENTTGGSNYATRNQVKIKTNNGAYVNLTADQLQDNGVGFNTYHCFKDVTTIVQAGGTNARYTIANIPVRVGNTNVFGGWSIVIVYKNDLQPMRNLTVFNGLSNVSGANPTTDITVNGFLTPLSGPVTFEVGDLTYDGDRSSTGDQLMFNGGSGYVNISDAVNPLSDIFNSTYSYNGVEKTTPFINPGYTNSLGYDADIFIPNNAAKNYIGNSATTATLRLTTGGETFLTQVVTMAIDVYEPDLRAAVRARDINGGLVLPGDTIEYTVVGKNIGSDPSINTFITDTIERNGIYVPGSLKITSGPNAGNKTDATGDDQGEYIAGQRLVKVRIGSSAGAVTGGQVNNSSLGIDSTQFKFRVTATPDCMILLCDNVINARAYIFGTGNVSGNTWNNGSNPDIFNAFGCPVSGTTNTLIQSGGCTAPAALSNSPVCTGGTINLSETPSSGNVTYSWTGPGGFTSTSATPTRGPATVAMAGTYTCVITVTGYSCTYTVTTVVAVNAAPTTSNAGPDQTICRTVGSATMAGNTAAVGTGTWTQISGPSTATITTPASPTTTITALSTAGTYVFQWSITNATCTPSTDQISVIVNAPPTVANAGPDQTICANTVTMAGNTAAVGTGTWTQISGPVTGTITTPSSPTTTVTGITTAGTYVFQWTITNAPCSASSDQVQIIRNGAPTTSNAGPDQTICSTSGSATMAGNTAAVGTGTWTQISGPSTATITTPASPTTTITAMTTAGTYVFQWTISNAPCTASTDQISVIVNAPPTVADAGTDQTICANTVTMAGNTAAVGTGTWTQISGPVTGTITTPSSPTTTITGITTAGTYVFQWTITNAPCSASSDQVQVIKSATPTTSNAGPDQTICTSSGSAIMAGNVAVVGSGTWTQISGPITATITLPLSPVTTITGMTTAGTYVFQWTITNGSCTPSTDQISVIVNAPPTTSNAGPDQTICANTVTMAGNTPAVGTGAWTQISGPVVGTITTPSSPTTTVTGITTAGTYVFQWTITNAPCSASSDQVQIIRNGVPTTSNAGPDQTICSSSGSATMAGNTAVVGTGAWTQISGPVTATITTPASPTTTITAMTTAGTYVFQWTISNGSCTPSTDQISVVVNAPPTTSNAGPDQTICANTVTMAGNTATVGTGAWTQISGPVTGTITTPSSPTTTVTGLTTAGTYVFQWTITNAPCSASSDQVQIIRNGTPTTSNAGPDQTICSTTASATMAGNTAAVGTGVWTQVSGPVTATITTPASPTTTITAMTTAGTYVFQWTISNAPCTASSDQISVIVNAPPTTSNAGPDQTICANTVTMAGNTAASGTGTWTQISGPVVGTITTPSSPTTTVTGITNAGTYVFQWTITNAPCSASSDQVSIIRNATTPASNAGTDQTLCNVTTTTMAANVAAPGTGAWTQVSGPNSATITTANSPTTTMTGLIAGTYVFQWTISNAPCPATNDQVSVIISALPTTSNAGTDQAICGNSVTMNGNTPSIGTGTWTQISGPNSATITSATSPTTSMTGLIAGTYVFQWTISNSPCSASGDQVSVDVSASPTTANAGIDQTICSSLASATMAGNTPAIGTGTWTQISGPVTGTITTPSSPSTTITGLSTSGTYVFQWTIANGTCPSSSDQVSINVNDPPTISDAGTDQELCGAVSVTMVGNTPAVGTGTWTQMSGPNSATITSANSPSTSMTGLISGTYVFQWNIINAPCAGSSDQVTIVIDSIPTTANAGSDQSICSASGSATMTANTATIGSGVWTQLSGPVTATITSPSSEVSSITGMSVAGTYIFQWTISNGVCAPSNDQVQIDVSDPPTTAVAGSSQSLCNTTTANTFANTPVIGTGLWTEVSGPNSATITTPSSENTTITNMIAGTYIFQWTISNGPCTASSDQTQIDIFDLPTVANAGTDQTICNATATTMSANTATTGAGLWSEASGPSVATITSPSSETTTMTNLVPGTYQFVWTISNGTCAPSTDTVSVLIETPPTVSDAGSDLLNVCPPTITMAANTPLSGVGVWSQVSGPNSSSIVTPNSPTTSISNIIPGTYVFVWTITNGSCGSSTDTIQVVAISCDSDGDGVPDITEISDGTDPNNPCDYVASSISLPQGGNWNAADCDGDGVINGTEITDGTNPNNPCDYVSANITLPQGGNWNTVDCDGDGVINGTEITDGTNPNNPCDYLASSETLPQGGNWNTADCDGDGVINGTEITDGTNPNNPCDYLASSETLPQGGNWNTADCDGDGVPNGTEITDGTNPNNPCSYLLADVTLPQGGNWNTADCDGDGVPNGTEVTDGTNPTDPCSYVLADVTLPQNGNWNAADCDGDGVPNGTEVTDGTNPNDPCSYVLADITLPQSGNWNAADCDGDGVPNGTEVTDGTSPTDPCSYVLADVTLPQNGNWNAADCDGDGVPNGTEVTDGTNPNDPCSYVSGDVTLPQSGNWNTADCDGDGVINSTEITDGTNPNNPCDYLAIHITLTPGGNWNTADCDGDGVINGTEITDGTDPNNSCDYVTGSITLPQGGNWNTVDCDGDGVINGTEITDGTNPTDPCSYLVGSITLTPGGNWSTLDCDGDGVTNGTEITDGTNPNNPCDYLVGSITLPQGGNWNLVDCDGDGVINGTEITDGTNPNNPCDYLVGSITLPQGGNWNLVDCDGDGVINGTEITDGTNPNDPCSYLAIHITLPQGGNWNTLDCDGDGVINGTEITDGTNPADPCSYVVSNVTLPQGGNWNAADCDGDGVINGTEITDGTNPTDPCSYVATNVTLPQGGNWNTVDCDGDGVINGTEITDGTIPTDPCSFLLASQTVPPNSAWNDADCDGDGITNGSEVSGGSNPLNSCDPNPCDLVVPQGFSPNGDGINDIFEIKGISNYPNNNISIFNRWGNIVYEAKAYDNTNVKWDGTNQGKLSTGTGPVPEGTYFYVIDLGDGSKPLSGYVFINRQ